MSVNYVPVQWNRFKYLYDAALALGVALYLVVFVELGPTLLGHAAPITPQIHNARAFGSCAFLMMTVILTIGPLARLDRRFLPMLYNRRHFGVMTAVVAASHFFFVFNWYFVFTPFPSWEALLFSNTAFDRALGFPFEALGLFALVALMILAATSHDFWLSFLTPRIWKALHYLIYPAYAAVVGHVTLGVGQSEPIGFAVFVWALALVVAALHVAAWARERRTDGAAGAGSWEAVCRPAEIAEGRARVARLSTGERVAVFRHEGRLSAISNACAHQNGPLGEGRVIDGCVTCPWHGFQYRLEDGCAPAPFTEKLPTYRLRLRNGMVEVDPKANPPGTPVTPLEAPA